MMVPSIPLANPDSWIALLALDAAARADTTQALAGYRLNDDRESLSAEQIVSLLVTAPKPIVLGFSVNSNALHIRWRHVDAAPDWAVQGEFFRFLARRYQGSLQNLDVLCLGAGRVLRVKVRDFEQFQRDYHLEFPYTVTGDFFDESEAAAEGLSSDQLRGIVAIARFKKGAVGGWRMYTDPTPPRPSRN